MFSVSFLEIDARPLDALPARRRRTVLRELGRKLEDGVRTMDRVAHGYDGSLHRFATILPETAAEGARVSHERLVEQVREFLTERGVDPAVAIDGALVTLPGDDEVLGGHLAEWKRIDAAEHEIDVT